MVRKIVAILIACAALALPAAAEINVVTSAPNLADITRSIGGNLVSVTSLVRPADDIHFVEPRPSLVVRLRGADMVVLYGMSFDAFMRPLIDNARNRKIAPGGPGYVNASVGVRKIEVPKGKVDASQGDIHAFGNPHYWLDPENTKVVARNILAGLKRAAPDDASYFEKNYDAFESRIDSAMKGWSAKMAPFKGMKVVTYHKSWIYFLRRFGLVEFDTVEVKPGIAPTPSHLRSLISGMKRENVGVIIMEPFYSEKFPKLIARETGAKIVVAPTSVGGAKGIKSYFDLMDRITDSVVRGLK